VLSKAVTQAQNIESKLSFYASQGKSVLGLFSSAGVAQTRQQAAFARLEAMRDTRLLFTVVTPWATYPNMAIEDLTPVQPEDTKQLTDFTVILKQLRIASTTSVPLTASKFAGRAAAQNSAATQLGKLPSGPLPSSIALGLMNGFK
jgi:hypothetical protein